jgi:hypothetical protein
MGIGGGRMGKQCPNAEEEESCALWSFLFDIFI